MNRTLCSSVLIVASGSRVSWLAVKVPPPPPPHTHTQVVHSTDRSRAVVPVCLTLCFSPLSIANSSLVEGKDNLSAFRRFVRFALV